MIHLWLRWALLSHECLKSEVWDGPISLKMVASGKSGPVPREICFVLHRMGPSDQSWTLLGHRRALSDLSGPYQVISGLPRSEMGHFRPEAGSRILRLGPLKPGVDSMSSES